MTAYMQTPDAAENEREHRGVAARWNYPEPCDIRVGDWPYECIAKDKNPNATVYECVTHRAWWHS